MSTLTDESVGSGYRTLGSRPPSNQSFFLHLLPYRETEYLQQGNTFSSQIRHTTNSATAGITRFWFPYKRSPLRTLNNPLVHHQNGIVSYRLAIQHAPLSSHLNSNAGQHNSPELRDADAILALNGLDTPLLDTLRSPKGTNRRFLPVRTCRTAFPVSRRSRCHL